MLSEKHVKAARVANAVNNALRMHFNEPANASWDELDDESKHRAMIGVAKAAEDPDMTPMECHKLWIESMAADGYRFGENIDYVRKEHPAMVPYTQLPEPQKLKTQLFLAIVRALVD